jgi:hypothetical protein
MVHQLLKLLPGEGAKMQTQAGMDVLVMAELVRLQRDQTTLEGLYQRLPAPAVEARFLSLWSDVQKRADRLEYMLDHMA